MSRVEETIAFLRMASIQMGVLSEHAPEIKTELEYMALQLQVEADELEKERDQVTL
jgi:hypothetical protein